MSLHSDHRPVLRVALLDDDAGDVAALGRPSPPPPPAAPGPPHGCRIMRTASTQCHRPRRLVGAAATTVALATGAVLALSADDTSAPPPALDTADLTATLQEGSTAAQEALHAIPARQRTAARRQQLRAQRHAKRRRALARRHAAHRRRAEQAPARRAAADARPRPVA
ncbi:MAG: hypothetical protein LC790_00170, partial [Actinobacteria bacterium]|nr:hypothetical protein [Actinomycetota bacterium]